MKAPDAVPRAREFKTTKLPAVRVVVRSTTSRIPFRTGSYMARLEDDAGVSLGATRGHATWATAARAALRLADARGLGVSNRDLVEKRAATEVP